MRVWLIQATITSKTSFDCKTPSKPFDCITEREGENYLFTATINKHKRVRIDARGYLYARHMLIAMFSKVHFQNTAMMLVDYSEGLPIR